MSSYHVYGQVYVFVSRWDIFHDTNLFDISHDMISGQTNKTNLTDKQDGPSTDLNDDPFLRFTPVLYKLCCALDPR